MDVLLKQEIISTARRLWDDGDLLKAGMILFERIPLAFRATWAADILAFISQHILTVPQIQDVIAFARTPDKWAYASSKDGGRDAHHYFDAVRSLTLADRKAANDDLYLNVLLLAENAAKVTYNAYGYPAPFDHDAGWWITVNLKKITDLVNETEFLETAWKVLANETFIELETPIRCNPYCFTCIKLQTFDIK